MGLFETMHINADGMEDYCKRYGANITAVCQSQQPARELGGETLCVVREAMEEKVPLERLGERRAWRERRLAALSAHKREMRKQEEEGEGEREGEGEAEAEAEARE